MGGMAVASCDMAGLLANRIHAKNMCMYLFHPIVHLSLVYITLHACIPIRRAYPSSPSLWTGLGGLASDKGSLQRLACFCEFLAFL